VDIERGAAIHREKARQALAGELLALPALPGPAGLTGLVGAGGLLPALTAASAPAGSEDPGEDEGDNEREGDENEAGVVHGAGDEGGKRGLSVRRTSPPGRHDRRRTRPLPTQWSASASPEFKYPHVASLAFRFDEIGCIQPVAPLFHVRRDKTQVLRRVHPNVSPDLD
jgi:hypothetical protein